MYLSQMLTVTRSYPVIVTIDGVSFPDSLGSFVDHNDPVDAEINNAVESVLRGEPYEGGGGAGVCWSIRPAE